MKKFLVGPTILLTFLLTLELLARIAEVTILKSFVETSDLRTKLEQIAVPPTLPAKKPDELRVFLYGESTMEGFPLSKYGFASQFNLQLHHIFSDRRDIQVVNLGRSGYDSTMIRYMVISTLSSNPDLIVIYTGHNEFVFSELDIIGWHKATQFWRDNSAFFRILISISRKRETTSNPLYKQLDPKGIPFRLIEPYYKLKLWIFKNNMQAMVNLAKARGIPVVLFTAASNLSDWPPPNPKVTFLPRSDEYYLFLDALTALVSTDRRQEALRIIQKLRLKYPQDASLMFLEGKLFQSEGDWQKAAEAFKQAREWSLMPSRAPDELNDFIRGLADNKSIWVIDTVKSFTERSEHGLPGYDLFLDNVHPTIEANYHIAKLLLDTLKDKQMVKPTWWRDSQPMMTLTTFLSQNSATPAELVEAHLLEALFCLKFHFSNFNCAKRELTQAQQLIANDWRVQALLAVVAIEEGNVVQGKTFFKTAHTLHPGEWGRKEFEAVPHLYQYRQYVGQ